MATEVETVARAPRELPELVRGLVREYVNRKTEDRSGRKWEDFKDKWITDPATGKQQRDVPEEYRKRREEVCLGAFYRIRASRSRQDFCEYFTGTICSVAQYLPEHDYLALARAWSPDSDDWEDMRSLALLALSSLSTV